jgi:hypothetical protein
MAMPLSEVLRKPNEREPLDPLRFHQPPRAPRLWILVAVLAALTLAAIVLSPLLAHAQLAVSDAPVEANTTTMTQQLDTTNSQLGSILTQDTTTAQSLTVSGCSGIWTDETGELNGLMQILASGVVDPQTFGSLYVGYEDAGPQSIYTAETITNQTLKADAAALGVVQAQANNFQVEGVMLANIEGCSAGATTLMAALKANTESNLVLADQQRLTRQLLMTLINVWSQCKAAKRSTKRHRVRRAMRRSSMEG